MLRSLTAYEIGEGEWVKACTQVEFKETFADPAFIKIYADTYKMTSRFFAVRKQNKIEVLLSTFSSRKTLLYPIHYMFTPMWINSSEGEIVRNRAVEMLLAFLKQRFKHIALRLPTGIKDIRPFYWQGFSAVQRFTYIKDLNTLKYHTNIHRILKKENNYSFKTEGWLKDVEAKHRQDLFGFQFSKAKTRKILASFERLTEAGFMIVVNGYQNGIMVGSDVILIDEYQKKAYMFFIGKNDGHYKTGFPSFQYDYVFNYLKNRGIEKVDMSGANYRSIAVYKSKFCPKLDSYFEVRYSFYQEFLNTCLLSLKKLAKRILR